MISKQIFAGLVLLFCLMNEGSAIRCYKCHSDVNPECGANFKLDEKFAVDCNTVQRSDLLGPLKPDQSATPTQCSTAIAQVPNGSGTDSVYYRGCLFTNAIDVNDKCMKPVNPNANFKECRTCEGDLCNSATKLTIGTLLFVTILSIFLH